MQDKSSEQAKLAYWTALDGHIIPVLLEEVDEPSANIVLVHGLAGDMDEADGLFEKASRVFRSDKMQVTRFDFRGHGRSKISSSEMTIAGEVLDLGAVLAGLQRRSSLPIVLVCASLGALSCFDFLSEGGGISIAAIALWNPVIDARKTFVDPGTDWSKKNFSDFVTSSSVDGVKIGDFEVGRKFWNELASKNFSEKIVRMFRHSAFPILIFHGSEDVIVPVSITKELSTGLDNVELRIVEGVGHGFLGQHDLIVDETAKWIRRNISK